MLAVVWCVGADRLSNYEEVLGQIQYVNSHPGDVNHRTFVLSCTELNGRFVSNQLDVTVRHLYIVCVIWS